MMDQANLFPEASAILARAPLIDGHNDLPYVIHQDPDARGDVTRWDAARRHPETDTDIPRLRAGLVGTQIFTAFIPTTIEHPLRRRLEIIDVMLQLEQRYPESFLPVLAPDDIDRARAAGRIGLFKAVEGLVGIDHVGHLRLFHAMGIRLVTLCHNETLPFIDSATDHPGPAPLSDFGVEIVAEMERLGLVIDLAHASAAAQHAVMDVAKGPVVISHANARALCDHPRNAPDDVIRRVAEGGGLVMATFVPAFLQQRVYDRLKPVMDGLGKMRDGVSKSEYQEAKRAAFAHFAEDGIALLCRHLDHMRDIAGEDALGIGSDFYGGPQPPGLEDVTCFPALFDALLRRGWSADALEKLAGRNFTRVWRQVYRTIP
ncbi:MAG: dipeptidase [Hyphomicrobiales bacterium]|uniref:dipeptidase n=1 Tax=Rhabdaerophilum calidifontis TaxID=2604328 RepID=UPI00123B8A2D|nr:membrane dipeptidase [Rhabdaerophilum calidifontis]MCA1998507.1 dipeptidase [Hyphomicrobiales bacterium]